MNADECLPRVLHGRVVWQVERHLTRSGELPLDREEADSYAHRAVAAHPGRCRNVATRRPSPTGRMLDTNDGCRSIHSLNARRATVPVSDGSGDSLPETRPLQRTLSATTSAPGSRRDRS